MPNINITVAGKIATNMSPGVTIVCGNSDYTVTFSFDEEWSAYQVKTARFVYTRDGQVQYDETVFTGNMAAVPVLSGITAVYVGVYAGDLRTTTPARILCDRSILCGGGVHPEPAEDVYQQIIKILNSGAVKGDKGDKGDKGERGEPGLTTYVAMLEEQEMSFSELSWSSTMSEARASAKATLVLGESYVVKYDGLEYVCECFDTSDFSGDAGPSHGLGSMDFSGCPFCIVCLDSFAGVLVYAHREADTPVVPHTVGIYRFVRVPDDLLPEVGEEHNDQFLQVVGGKWVPVNAVPQVTAIVNSCIADTFVPLTQEEYDALVTAGTYDANKYYLIVGDSE